MTNLATTQPYLQPRQVPRLAGVEDLVTLSAGGFGTVYRGYQPRFDRWVAVKVLDRHRSDPARLVRFERECALLGRLTGQPGVLRIYDCGYLDSGDPYLLTELCPEGSLSDRLKACRTLPVAEVLEVGRTIGAALATMHADGVLHRDVKPSNILARGNEGPVLCDFGQAIRLGDTDPSPLVASDRYAAPEVLADGRWSAAADVYALGATLSTLLGEKTPRSDAPRPNFPAEAGRLLAAMLDADPLARPTADEVVTTLNGSVAATSGPTLQPHTESAPWWASPAVTAGEPVEELTQLRVPVPERRRPGRRALIAAGAAALLLVGVGAAAGKAHLGRAAAAVSSSVTPSAAAPTAPAAPAPTAPAPAATDGPRPTTPASPRRTVRVPAGYRLVPSSQGLRVAVPVGWLLQPVPGTSELRAVDPANPARFLQFGGYRPGHVTQLGRVQGYAAGQRAGYQELRLAAVPYGVADEAVDWEYTYLAGDTGQHARGRYWRQGAAEYVVYVSAPAADWAAVQPAFAVLLDSARPR